MKALLCYFTGTYNTLYVTTLIKNRLMANGYEVDQICLSSYNKQNTSGYDVIGIGYPIHAFNTPKIVVDTIKKMNLKNNKYFIYKVSGEPFKLNSASSYELYKMLKKNNNELLGEYHYVMPYNILFKTRKDVIIHELKYVNKYVNYMCNNLLSVKPYKVNLFYRFVSNLFKIQRLGCKINIKNYKVDEDRCTRCHKCIDLCPNKNIVFNKELRKIEFKNNCSMCMRCSYLCPSNAINIGLLEKYKVNGQYSFLEYMKKEDNYDINNEKERFYKKFKKYYDNIDLLTSK